ncbi:TPA: helix-turn-helix transcriptional regulator [Streptococcus suis]|nr:helix-turn-helix transcriptional regulator [Streptococcus suis]HEM3718030.1 helix-turn-helix transcriptional regulator [Streptococcus suis]
MTRYSPYLKSNPSGFPYDFKKVHIQSGLPEEMYHWHPELEIIFVQSGSASYYISQDRFQSQAGYIFFIQPSTLHSIHPIEGIEEETTRLKIHLDNLGRQTIEPFSQRYIQPLHSGHFFLTPCIKPTDKAYVDIRDCLLGLYSIIQEEGIYYDIMMKAKLHELLYLLFKNRYVRRQYTDDTYQKYQKLKELISYLQEHYSEKINIQQLAQRFGYSKNHFMSIFKHHTGSSCVDFILQLRLNKACEALLQSNLTISEIAHNVGFENLSNFNRQFKKRFNMTPKQYRKEQINTKNA